jgi:hypothetical protein
MLITLHEVLDSYRTYLLHDEATNPHQQTLRRFDERLQSHPESAKAEAAVFEYLRQHNLHPQLAEDATTGGADFYCKVSETEVVVEVTAIGTEAFSSGSGMADDLDDCQVGYFNMPKMTALLRNRASKKTRQVDQYHCPRVLVIAGFHSGSSILFGQSGIEEFMTGGSMITIPLGPEGMVGSSYISADLGEAALIRPTITGGIELCRRAYSAILLMAIHGAGSHVMGMLHPEPLHQLPDGAFAGVPFATLQWPIRDRELVVRWVIHDPDPERHYFLPITMTDEEIREGLPSRRSSKSPKV